MLWCEFDYSLNESLRTELASDVKETRYVGEWLRRVVTRNE